MLSSSASTVFVFVEVSTKLYNPNVPAVSLSNTSKASSPSAEVNVKAASKSAATFEVYEVLRYKIPFSVSSTNRPSACSCRQINGFLQIVIIACANIFNVPSPPSAYAVLRVPDIRMASAALAKFVTMSLPDAAPATPPSNAVE